MNEPKNSLPRRKFLKQGALSIAALAATSQLQGRPMKKLGVPLGLDAHSMRGMGWKADQLLEYAAQQNADALLLNGPQYFRSLDAAHLAKLRATADTLGVRIYTGAGGICKNSRQFTGNFGTPEETLSLGIRLAKTFGSPVINCRIGNIDDRFTDGGIEARMEESIAVLKALRSQAEDANVKFAFENHAGDMRSDEILTIIHEVGPDICGSMLDPGNALWAMEDPMEVVQKLGPHVLCTSVRDYMVWEAKDGATFQWTSIGNGLMDAPAFAGHLATLAPGVPFFVETISNSPRQIPFLTKAYMTAYPNLRAADIMAFLALCRRGKPMELAIPSEGASQKKFDQQHQRSELLKSFEYLRKHCGVGLKAYS